MMYKENNIIEVKINAVEPYGAFAIIDNEYNGLIHISEINGKFIKDINDYIKCGDVLNAKILEVDEKGKKIKLSLIGVSNKLKKNVGKLSDTDLGFSLIEELLPGWIEKKMQEISSKREKIKKN